MALCFNQEILNTQFVSTSLTPLDLLKCCSECLSPVPWVRSWSIRCFLSARPLSAEKIFRSRIDSAMLAMLRCQSPLDLERQEKYRSWPFRFGSGGHCCRWECHDRVKAVHGRRRDHRPAICPESVIVKHLPYNCSPVCRLPRSRSPAMNLRWLPRCALS